MTTYRTPHGARSPAAPDGADAADPAGADELALWAIRAADAARQFGRRPPAKQERRSRGRGA